MRPTAIRCLAKWWRRSDFGLVVVTEPRGVRQGWRGSTQRRSEDRGSGEHLIVRRWPNVRQGVLYPRHRYRLSPEPVLNPCGHRSLPSQRRQEFVVRQLRRGGGLYIASPAGHPELSRG